MATFQNGNLTSYYEDAGSGAPLVLICGIGADLQVWRTLVPRLVERFRVLTVDNRGAGRSSAPDEPYTIGGMADDLHALLTHLGIASAHVVGWSMGGAIAQSLAIAHPQTVKHLVLVGSFAAPDGMLKNAITTWNNIRRSNMNYEEVARYVARLIYSPSLANDAESYEAYVQAMVANPYRQSLNGFVRQAAALVGYAAPRELSSLRVPTSIFVGEHDQLAPPYLSKQLAAVIPGATYRVLPGLTPASLNFPSHTLRRWSKCWLENHCILAEVLKHRGSFHTSTLWTTTFVRVQ